MWGALEINKNMLLWINDALMAVFFLLIGLEVKRELIQGVAGEPPSGGLPGDSRAGRHDRPGPGLPGL
ncbi:Na+/H+ antiporter NhaA type [Klebsiella pneumoniae]|uniref:Na+/H+ antiporter NhaA type n=1 Tax=Klebsiella pneumoniae TaxID=573 RepID=A0A3S4HCF2_KLEPN|nr:Na+/H+ antiporter NhaA type [Klebsiella pneumoniae]